MVGTRSEDYLQKMINVLSQDLSFHNTDSSYASHSFHPFPAKFPPQLPRKFITELTAPNEIVLDPMVGSGTTILEASLLGRYGIGFDIDPLALLISQVKVRRFNKYQLDQIGNEIIKRASTSVEEDAENLATELENRWDLKTKEFIDYWFAPEIQIELLALINEIEKIADDTIRAFFRLTFSSVIITKSGGVSYAFDLAHTRPHRAKVVISQQGEILLGQDLEEKSSARIKLLTKKLRSPITEFQNRLEKNLNGLLEPAIFDEVASCIKHGDVQDLPLDNESTDLVVTSPPYASNAIDYMRAHKFSLVWLGYMIGELGQKRKEYIGGESLAGINFEGLPQKTQEVVMLVSQKDERKSRILHRYYSEMTCVLQEIFRVLKSGKAAIVVVGNSVWRGQSTETHTCIADIGESIGFHVAKIGVRNLDRNRRMLPMGFGSSQNSQIQQRMHKDYIIGFYKPKI